MAANPDFMKGVFDGVEMIWPRLDQTYRYDERKEESVPCAPTANSAAWSVSVELTRERAEAFRKKAEDHYNSRRASDASLPEFSGVFGMKERDGKFTLACRKNGTNRDGEVNDAPKVVDQYHDPLTDRAIWSGSKGSVSILAHPSKNPQNGLGGISIILRNVLVTEPRYGGNNLEDDFGPAKQRSATDIKGDPPSGQGFDERNPPPQDLDDEIPF